MDRFDNIIPISNGSCVFDNFIIHLKTDYSDIDLAADALGTLNPVGAVMTGVTLKQTGTQYIMQVYLSSLFVINKRIYFDIVACGIGYGAQYNYGICEVCKSNYFNISPNNTKPCASCDSQINNKAVECYDGNIYIKYGHWMDITPNNLIISAQCPPLHCCQDEICDVQNQSMLCAENRDYTSVLCSKCMKGYSQSISSAKCVKCDGNHWEYLMLPLMFSLIFVGYLVGTKSEVVITNKKNKKIGYLVGSKSDLRSNTKYANVNVGNSEISNSLKRLITNRTFIYMIQTMIIKIIIYYQQSLSYVISTH
eukprot:435982_1